MTFFASQIWRIALRMSLSVGTFCLLAIGLGSVIASPTIVYMYDAKDTRSWDLAMLDVWRGVTLRITNTPMVNERYPTWSPNGAQIAYHANRVQGSIYEIFIRPAQLGQFTPYQVFISEGNVGEFATTFERAMPAWSPNGMQLGFHAKTNTGRYGIFIGNATGEQIRMMIHPPESGDALHVAWSPDGTQIAFAEFRTDGRFLYRLPVSDVVESVTTNRARMQLISDNGFFPAWSPDGSQMVYVATSLVGGSQLMLYDLQTETSTLLFGANGADDTHPHWSHDGHSIVFASNRLGEYDLYLLTVATGHIRRLTFGEQAELAPKWGIYAGG